jgi:tetratricopeptide (TPR) repeat protein
MDIPPPDVHHLRAALGWLELGNHVEAGEELARISPARLEHPDVLELRWAVCAEGRSWAAAAEVGGKLVAAAPDRVSGWVHRAFAERRRPGGGLQQAQALLLPALERFPAESIVPYNLACYAAQMGRLDDAWSWLQRAMSIEKDPQVIRERALADPDLEPLWARLR